MHTDKIINWFTTPAKNPGTLGAVWANAAGVKDLLTLPLNNGGRVVERVITLVGVFSGASLCLWGLEMDRPELDTILTLAAISTTLTKIGAVASGMLVDWTINHTKDTLNL